MKINLTKDKALKMLNDRLRDCQTMNYNQSKAWKSRTDAEVQSIFPITDSRHFEISRLFFGTQYVDSFFLEKKIEACNLLQSYIDFIKEHIQDSVVAMPREYEKEFRQQQVILDELSKKVNKYENYLGEFEFELKSKDSTIVTLSQRIQELENTVFQTENINALGIWKLLINLPGKLQLSLIAFFVLIGTAGYYIGCLFKLIMH